MKNLDDFKRHTILGLLILALVEILFDVVTNGRFYFIELCTTAIGCVVFMGLYIAFWRCPSCKKMLPLWGGNISVCPYCGKKLKGNQI